MSARVTAKAVSHVSEQLPSFIGEDFPLYEKFVKNYYEFLETIVMDYGIVTGYEDDYTFTLGETITGQTSGATGKVKGTGANSGLNKLFIEPTNDIDFSSDETFIGSSSNAYGSVTKVFRNPVNALKTFTSLIDLSRTSDGVLEYFKKELYANIRKNAVIDLKDFAKHIKEFYRSKGSEKSFRTLFRMLYGQENLDFYLPKTDLLKVSDGIWSQDTVLQIAFDTEYFNFNGLTITGSSSSVTAFVSNVTTRKLGTISIIELVLTNRSGDFTLGETITATTASGTVLSATVTGQMTDISINDGGAGYNDGETLVINDSTLQGFGAVATIARTSRDQVTVMTVDNAGNGFQVNDSFVFDNTATNVDVTAEAKVRTISDAYNLDVITTQIYLTIETITLNISGASTALPFTIAVQAGNLVTNNAVFGDATKVAEVVAITDSELHLYDRSNEDGTLSAIANGDSLFLFDKNRIAVTGSTSCVIDDGTITNPTSDIAVNATTYGSGLNSANRLNQFQSAMTSETQTFGKIATINITSHGSGYETAPTVSVSNGYYENLYESDGTGFRGRNASVTIGALGGSIVDIKGGTISEEGFGYISPPTVTATINSFSSGSSSADLTALLTDVKTKDGKFNDDSGKPSSQKKIQDNDYYQDFSYVIQAADSINVWKQDVLKLLHPAGLKLFGEVAIASVLNAALFDRGNNNINSVLSNGLQQYRDLLLQLLTEVLNNSKVKVSTSLVKEVEYNILVDNLIGQTFVELEDGGNLRSEEGGRVEYAQFFEDEIITSIIEQLQPILTESTPAEFFSLLSVKDITSLNSISSLFYEDGDVIVQEDGDNILAEESRTTIHTSEPHYFHENDQIFLDGFAGTNVDRINKRLFSVSDVDVENSAILLEDNNNMLLETNDVLRSEDIAVFTLSDPISTTNYGTIDNSRSDFSTDNISITTNGKIYRSSTTASSGLPISLINEEYIGEYTDYVIDNYIYHFNSNDLTSVSGNDAIIFEERRLAIESHILLEDNDELLLEDSLNASESGYSGTSSNLGKLLADEGVLDRETSDEILLTDQQQKIVRDSFLKDETIVGDDNIIYEDGNRIELEDSVVRNGVVHFDRPFEYIGQPHENNNGFGYFKHRVNQRVSV